MVEKVTTIDTFQGMSGDEKPTGLSVSGGSTFHCVDTGDVYVYYADGWVLDLRGAADLKRSVML